MTGPQGSKASAFGVLVHSFQDEFTNHRDELRVSSYACGPNDIQAKLIRKRTGLRVEVIHNFHVVCDKAKLGRKSPIWKCGVLWSMMASEGAMLASVKNRAVERFRRVEDSHA